jgi:hypothetical protein
MVAAKIDGYFDRHGAVASLHEVHPCTGVLQGALGKISTIA